ESRREGKAVYTALSNQFGKAALAANLYPSANRYVSNDIRAKPLSAPEPEIPAYFELSGVSAWAVVHYDITEDGKVENANVVASFPIDGISEYVLEAVNAWRFEPPKDLYGDPMRLEMQSKTFRIKATSGSQTRKFQRDSQEY